MQKIRFLFSRDDWYHQRGYWVVANALTKGGVEVILGGIQTPAEMAETALAEDVDVIGFRIMNASPQVISRILFEEMEKCGISDIPVVLGGIIPEKDEKIVKDLGVKEVFHPFTPLETLQERVKEIALEGRKNREM